MIIIRFGIFSSTAARIPKALDLLGSILQERVEQGGPGAGEGSASLDFSADIDLDTVS